VEIYRWLKWCRAKKDVKCSESEVPDGILPKQYKGVLIDVKVSGRGPDDKLYGAHEDLRKKVFNKIYNTENGRKLMC
jgi:hypothetical protein